MKKTLLLPLALLFFCVSTIEAQITITQNDMPAVNTKIIMARDTMYMGTVGSAGTNKTWNFSSLMNQRTDTTVLFNPSTTQCGVSFPTATHCMTMEDGYGYFMLSATSLEILGFCGDLMNTGDTITLVFNPPQTFITFPSQYNSSFSGASGFSNEFANPDTQYSYLVDSVRMQQNTDYLSINDGWGQLTTPTGTYNVLRQFYSEITTTSQYIHCTMPALPPAPCTSAGWLLMDSSTDTTFSYRYWSDLVNFIVLEIKTNRDTIVESTEFYIGSGVNIEIRSQTTSALLVSPNPSLGYIRIVTAGNTGGKAIITDISGREINSYHLAEKVSIIDTGLFPQGLYCCRIISEDGSIMVQTKFAVVK